MTSELTEKEKKLKFLESYFDLCIEHGYLIDAENEQLIVLSVKECTLDCLTDIREELISDVY